MIDNHLKIEICGERGDAAPAIKIVGDVADVLDALAYATAAHIAESYHTEQGRTNGVAAVTALLIVHYMEVIRDGTK